MSTYSRKEIDHAALNNKRIVPIFYQPVPDDDIPEAVAKFQRIDFGGSDGFDAKFAKLIAALDTDLDWKEAHTRLLTRAKEWAREKDSSFLLRGKDLREAEQWMAKSAEKEPKPTTLHSQYILASRQSATKTQRIIIAAFGVAFLIAVGLSFFAFTQKNEVASRELAAKAEEQLPDNPAAARDLAIKAWELKHTKYARNAIVDAYSMPVLELKGYAAAFSPDGRRLATLGDGMARVWDAITGEQLTEMEGSQGYTEGTVAFSPDGRRVLVGERRVGLWDAATGKKLRELEGSRGRISAFSPDSQRVAAGIEGGYIGVWDATTGQLLKRLEGDDSFQSLAFSQDGKRVVTPAGVWNATTGNQVVEFPTHSFGGDSVEGYAAFSSDGHRAVAGGFDGDSGVWDAMTGKLW